MVVSEGARAALLVTRFIIVGMVGYDIGGESLGHRGCTVGAASRASGSRYCVEQRNACLAPQGHMGFTR